jgi:UDP-2-acetamido-3-amino-2,3-dideoxy-glucuronate N-acetyltransferase
MIQNIAVVGCGYWGKNLVRNFAELGALYAVCDQNQDLLKSTAAQYGVKALAFEDALKDSAIKGVVIAAPAALHYKLCRMAILAGKDVFVEKPLALNTQDAKELNDLATTHKTILMVGHLLHYHPAYLSLKKMVLAGDLGDIQYLYSNRLSLGKIRTEEDVLWSFAPHDISMILGLAPNSNFTVTASGAGFITQGIADTATTHIAFENGIKAHISVSWLNPVKEQKLTVIGTKAMAVFDDTVPWDQKLILYPHKIERQHGLPVPVKAEGKPVMLEVCEPLKEECLHFLSCINTRQKPRTDGEEGLRVLTVLEKASQAMKENSLQSTNDYFAHESAYIDMPSHIGKGTKIWHFSHILPDTSIGENCTIGQNCVIGPKVSIGKNCKIQNNVSVYKGVTLEDGVFCGPSCVFTNVNNPRAEIERKDEFRETLVKQGVTIGANATILCGHTLGEYCFIAAGAVVTSDVHAYSMMAGVPAKRIGWMSKAGAKLGKDLICPIDGTRYVEHNGHLDEVKIQDKHKGTAHG